MFKFSETVAKMVNCLQHTNVLAFLNIQPYNL